MIMQIIIKDINMKATLRQFLDVIANVNYFLIY
jgi:hypothetical protein